MNEKIPVRQVAPAQVALYAAREKIHTRAFSGLFRNLRLCAGAVLLCLYFGTAWLQWNGHQAVWWNLPERQFHVFGATFWPQDFILLSGLLIVAAFGLFFVTVFAGRVWCGYACPQSVWTWMFMWCERLTEGDRNQRIQLDKAPMSAAKILRKAAKHGLWILIGLATGLTFVGYFSPIRDLLANLVTGQADGWAYFWLAFFTLATYGNAGWLREQVCIYMCPYARFQSVMFDKDTLTVSYDPRRGEKRGPRKKGADHRAEGLGDCVDCTLCVQVCPTGIDIRDGLQIECIGCAACIDACDSVMDKMDYPRGLIGYTTEHRLEGQKSRLLRPRLIGYGLALAAMSVVLAVAIGSRPLAGLDVIKDRALFRENQDGRIENVYTLKLINKAQRDLTFEIAASGLDDLIYTGRHQARVRSGEILSVPVALSSTAENLPASGNDVRFSIRALEDPGIRAEASSHFIGPSVRHD